MPESIDAVLAVHLYASQVDVRALRRRYPGKPIIEDCSHSHGARDGFGFPLGTVGDVAVFSLQSTKLLTCGEGGAALTDDRDLARALAALRADSRLPASRVPALGDSPLQASRLVHGANLAPSDLAAALLCAQLEPFDEQCRRRASGWQVLRDALPASVHPIGDVASLSAGTFYGLVLRLREERASDAIERVFKSTGARLWPVYRPIPKDDLYQPETVALFARGPEVDETASRPFPNGDAWTSQSLVVPHHLLLGSPALLTELGRAFEASYGVRLAPTPSRLPAQRDAPLEIGVVVLNWKGAGRSAREAVRSVIDQSYRGAIRILVVRDGTAPADGDLAGLSSPARALTTVDIALGAGFADSSTIERVSRLRNAALAFIDSPLVCFLDDDNVWECDHLSSLVELMVREGVPAVHSWRKLVDGGGRPWLPDRFPWLGKGPEAAELYDLYKRHGVLRPDDSVVRDRVALVQASGDHGMVDLGEWLFERAILRRIGFEVEYSPADRERRIGEDDKLLAQLRRLQIPTACTGLATLKYRLGGFSNLGAEREAGA